MSYQKRLVTAFQASCPQHSPLSTDLYGLVYHFFRRDIGIDADNLSKPVWDTLKGLLFDDDSQVKMRIAGSFDLLVNDLAVLDFSGLPGGIINTLLEVLETEEHVLYAECGNFTTDTIRLNLARNGN
ncbi:RusA family crossover junction endodeoxyribonuclease [Spirosoma sp. SC4-14]|uniref:RusA family crossover junction endodeoxyribonuclease n=1 Tax=Spirosoma sp. SC4-14 TaxID=3128900 RepID=UPI0030D50726